MLITCVPMQTHQSVALQCSEERPTLRVNEFKIIGRSISRRGTATVKENTPGLDALMGDEPHKHFLKMIIFGLTIGFRMVDSVINRPGISIVTG